MGALLSPYVHWLAGWSVGLSWFHERAGSYTPMLLSEHLFYNDHWNYYCLGSSGQHKEGFYNILEHKCGLLSWQTSDSNDFTATAAALAAILTRSTRQQYKLSPHQNPPLLLLVVWGVGGRGGGVARRKRLPVGKDFLGEGRWWGGRGVWRKEEGIVWVDMVAITSSNFGGGCLSIIRRFKRLFVHYYELSANTFSQFGGWMDGWGRFERFALMAKVWLREKMSGLVDFGFKQATDMRVILELLKHILICLFSGIFFVRHFLVFSHVYKIQT